MTTTSQKIAKDVAALLRARNSLLWVVTQEEARVEGYLFEAAKAAGYMPRTWDVGQGVCTMDGVQEKDIPGPVPEDILRTIIDRAIPTPDRRPERAVWILRHMHVWLGNGQIGAVPLRLACNLARMNPPRDRAQAAIIISPSKDIPPELANIATVVEWPLPDRAEVAALLDIAINNVPEFHSDANGEPDPSRPFRAVVAANANRDAAVDAAIGLSGEEVQAAFSKSLVQLRRIDPATIAQEKRRVVSRAGVLEWFDPLPGGLDAVGGLENLKAWLISRGFAYTPEARAYGLPAPKGGLLVGVPGCGKSLFAKATATAWGIPLLRIDLGALKSKFVGDSEQNLRKAFSVIGAIGRCVVWIDEVEKALQGATSGSADGGVSADALGAILSWMQERQGEAFVIATANDADALPPELLRKGRFDEVWWVDLPTTSERVAILAAALRSRGILDPSKVDTVEVAQVCNGFTGSEVAELVPDAMFRAFADGARPVTTDDLMAAVETVVPLSKMAEDKITKLRNWSKGRARPASAPEKSGRQQTSGSRAIDF